MTNTTERSEWTNTSANPINPYLMIAQIMSDHLGIGRVKISDEATAPNGLPLQGYKRIIFSDRSIHGLYTVTGDSSPVISTLHDVFRGEGEIDVENFNWDSARQLAVRAQYFRSRAETSRRLATWGGASPFDQKYFRDEAERDEKMAEGLQARTNVIFDASLLRRIVEPIVINEISKRNDLKTH